MRRLLKRVVLTLLLALLLMVARPVWHLSRTAWGDPATPEWEALAEGIIDDASRLNRSVVTRVVSITPEQAESQLRDILHAAAELHTTVSAAGARHSMGGQSFRANGIIVNLDALKSMSLIAPVAPRQLPLLKVQAGARWSEVIAFLDTQGLAVAVMQSDHSFSVGGSLSVNVHGWQAGRAPIASTVQALTLITANGETLHCRRNADGQLPSVAPCDVMAMALGGYGLFGIIVDAELQTVPNGWYRASSQRLPASGAAKAFRETIDRDPLVEMAYARLSVDAGNFLQEAAITHMARVERPGLLLPSITPEAWPNLQRTVFRGSVGSDYGKWLRWWIEQNLSPVLFSVEHSRNQLMSSDVRLYTNRSAGQTDILHEYFVPPEHLNRFLHSAREIIPRYQLDLLNVTLRDVRRDVDTRLAYADRDLVAVVMFFNQFLTSAAEQQMQDGTSELIEAALHCGGRYYLPYRPHATRAQFNRSYPQAAALFQRKRELDPQEILRNSFYDRYGAAVD